MTRDELEQLHARMQLCFKRDGPYTLSSGRTSAYYYDGREGTLYPPTAWLIGNACADVILEAGAEAVGGLELGSVPISDAVGLAAHLRGRELPTFVVRKAKKEHGTASQTAEARLPDGNLVLQPGRRVAIVDDAITTGGSIQQAIDVVQGIGCEVVVVVALVERHESAGRALRGNGYPVVRLFWTDESGTLHIDEEFARRAGAVPAG